jgi:hypothetical protein
MDFPSVRSSPRKFRNPKVLAEFWNGKTFAKKAE